MQLCNSSLHIHGQRRGVLNYCYGRNEAGWRPRSKFGAPMFEPEALRKQMYCTEVLATLLGIFGTPLSFGALIVIRRPGNCAPCTPSLRPWLLNAATHLSKSCYTALTRRIREPWAFGGAKFSICSKFCVALRKMNRRILQGDGSVSETCPKIALYFSWIF